MDKTKYEYEKDFEELIDNALNDLSSIDFDSFVDSIYKILSYYD